MIGVAENDLGTEGAEFGGGHGFYGAQGADGHELRGVDNVGGGVGIRKALKGDFSKSRALAGLRALEEFELKGTGILHAEVILGRGWFGNGPGS